MFSKTVLTTLCVAAATASFGQARLQVIHNCPAPAAASVDVWVNGTKLLPNFAFRTATPYLDVPSGVPLQVRIKPAGSTDTARPLFYRSYTLPANSNVVAIANGNIGTGFAPNPDNLNTGFDLDILTDGRLGSTMPGMPQVKVFHGSPDAPTVQVKVARTSTVLVPQAAFRQSSGWLDAPAANLDLDIVAGGNIVVRFGAPLSAFADSSLLVLASGYLSPATNNNGPAFGLLAVTPKGRTILLPAVTLTASLQVVHNCASPGAASVDVWVGNTKLLPGFTFRSATPYVSVPANTALQVRIKGPGSTDTTQPLFYRSYTLPPDAEVIAVATGNVGTGFAPNPDGIGTAFDLTILDGRQRSTTAGGAQVKVLHGATDAPTVRVKVSGTSTVLVPQAAFRQSSGWLDAPAANLNLDVDAFATGTTVATYTAPLAAFADSAVLVMASGYLAPTANNNGPAFALVAVTKAGRAVVLPTAVTAIAKGVKAEAMQVSPNPAMSRAEFILPNGISPASAELLDMTGRRVWSANEASTRVDLSGLPKGMYYLLARSTEGTVYQARLLHE